MPLFVKILECGCFSILVSAIYLSALPASTGRADKVYGAEGWSSVNNSYLVHGSFLILYSLSINECMFAYEINYDM